MLVTSPATSRRWFALALALALCTAFNAPPAVAASKADHVVQRYVEATGGRAALDSIRTLYTRARVEGFGFAGTSEVWVARPDRRRSRTRLGPFDLTDGAEGGRAWRTDPTTSKVVALEGREAAEASADAWYEWDRWAAPGAAGGRVEFVASRRDSTGAWTLLRTTPPAGRARTLWFDDATGLLGRSEAQMDGVAHLLCRSSVFFKLAASLAAGALPQ